MEKILDPFATINLGRFITRYEDWILFTLLLFFFWSIVGLTLSKRFENNKYARALITVIALFFSIGVFMSVYSGWLHLSLQGLGLLGVAILFIVVFFILYGLMRGYNIGKSKAIAFGYVLLYLSIRAVSPNLFDTLLGFFPFGYLLLNFIFIACVIITIVSVVKNLGGHTRKLDHAKSVLQRRTVTADDTERDQEIADDKKEITLLKGKTLKLTKKELYTLDHIEEQLRVMIDIIRREGSHLLQEDKAELTEALQDIKKNENILWRALKLLEKHVYIYHNKGKKDLIGLQKKLHGTQDKKQRSLVDAEITYQKRMIQALAYLEKYQAKISNLINSFNRFIDLAVERLRTGNQADAVTNLERAHRNLYDLKHIYAEQKSLEKYLLALEKKTVRNLKKEKAA